MPSINITHRAPTFAITTTTTTTTRTTTEYHQVSSYAQASPSPTPNRTSSGSSHAEFFARVFHTSVGYQRRDQRSEAAAPLRRLQGQTSEIEHSMRQRIEGKWLGSSKNEPRKNDNDDLSLNIRPSTASIPRAGDHAPIRSAAYHHCGPPLYSANRTPKTSRTDRSGSSRVIKGWSGAGANQRPEGSTTTPRTTVGAARTKTVTYPEHAADDSHQKAKVSRVRRG
ncbi:hypothetical protein B0O80DRAFT_524787 [Mortierella sp. GBAus27b]|nr:hypothetical protein B0O80DRAFT_524787 [Mortierella sp. GBAus27b]